MVDIINFAPFFELKVSAAGALPAVPYVFSLQSANLLRVVKTKVISKVDQK